MKIEPFGVEVWMNEWETRCDYNLAETCVESITVSQLLTLCGKTPGDLSALLDLKMGYGDIEGSPRLRRAIAKLYENQKPHNILTTHGTIGANMLVHKTLVGRDSHVVAVTPTYQQHYSIPESIGAKVQQLKLRAEDGFLPDPDALNDAVTGATVLIALTNPNNPTGALIDAPLLQEIVEIARKADAWILCDEVYRGTAQTGDGWSSSIADVYEKGIATGGMSKAYSLAGLRMGWIAAPAPMIERFMIHRDYDTISMGRIDDHFSALALENAEKILARARTVTRENLEILSGWVDREPRIDWIKPRAGTTALLQYDMDIPSRRLCLDLLKHTGVMFTPGEVLNMEGTLRIGFANPQAVLTAGLARVSAYLATL